MHPAATDDTFVLDTRHEGSQWLVDNPGMGDLLTFFTPVFPDAQTLGFLKNQVSSQQ